MTKFMIGLKNELNKPFVQKRIDNGLTDSLEDEFKFAV